MGLSVSLRVLGNETYSPTYYPANANSRSDYGFHGIVRAFKIANETKQFRTVNGNGLQEME